METQDNEPDYCGDSADNLIIAELDAITAEMQSSRQGDAPSQLHDHQRRGTISSARFNMLSTMVGGGALSLPLAFSKAGNAGVGPALLILTALLSEFCFRIHVGSARLVTRPHKTQSGNDTFESITATAFGSSMNVFSMALVTAMCFFGTVGYAVLLRDMLQPLTDAMWHLEDKGKTSGPTFHNNLTMVVVVLIMTPVCALKTMTALQRFGAASMLSVLILGGCVLYRSVECNVHLIMEQPSVHNTNTRSIWSAFQLFPESWRDVLDVFPLYVSCFVCHYNLLPVHNELRQPSAPRVSTWLRSTIWSATAFYIVMGISGSAYGHCTAAGHVTSGNVLLDFPENDPLLMMGRMCLAVTLALAFPMLTIPARDILLRECFSSKLNSIVQASVPSTTSDIEVVAVTELEGGSNDLTEPLLSGNPNVPSASCVEDDTTTSPPNHPSLGARLGAAVLFFWAAAGVASCVRSIDVVWDMLGSSLSILLSYLIPCGAYLIIFQQTRTQIRAIMDPPHDLSHPTYSKYLAWAIIVAFVPLMIISTTNAIYKTFFRHEEQ